MTVPTPRKAAAKGAAKATTKAAVRKPSKASAKPNRSAAKPARTQKAVSTPARRTAPTSAPAEVTAPAAGTIDLAGGLRTYLGSIDAEVRAVSSLSERIDALIVELNDLRDQQAKRLLVLDELRASVTDQSLGSFLDAAIKPRKTRVPEIIPERLS